MQKLILPFITNRMEAGYRNNQYLKEWKYQHYGVDLTGKDDTTIYSSGNGKVLYAGYDNSGGNVVIIQYFDVDLNAGKHADIIARYMHFETLYVRAGTTVTKDTALGIMGGTPFLEDNKTYRFAPHLHLEFDTDIKYPRHSPQVSSRDDKKSIDDGNILLHGQDTTISPMYILWETDERKMLDTGKSIYYNENEIKIKKITKNNKEQIKNKIEQIEKLLNEIKTEL